jgi:hypothetical protein
VKKGPYSPDYESVSARAKAFSERLVGQLEALKGTKKDIVIITHGAFLGVLTGETDWPNAGWRSYRVKKDSRGVVLEKEEPGLKLTAML